MSFFLSQPTRPLPSTREEPGMVRTVLVCTSLALFLAPALRLPADEKAADKPASVTLTPAEEKEVLALTEKALKDRKLLEGKVVLTRIDVFNDIKDDKPLRTAIVIHYRYKGNLAILTTVDVLAGKVENVETDDNFPTRL